MKKKKRKFSRLEALAVTQGKLIESQRIEIVSANLVLDDLFRCLGYDGSGLPRVPLHQRVQWVIGMEKQKLRGEELVKSVAESSHRVALAVKDMVALLDSRRATSGVAAEIEKRAKERARRRDKRRKP